MTPEQPERARKLRKVIVKNGGYYCASCGEFLGSTCDPFGRKECADKCYTARTKGGRQ